MQTAIVLSESDLHGVLTSIIQQAVDNAFLKAKGLRHKEVDSDHKDYLTLKEAAKYLHISRPTFIALRKGGAFPAHPVGNRHLFRRTELEAYVQSKEVQK